MPRVISGSEEARLIFLAVKHSIDLGGERGLVIAGAIMGAVLPMV